MLYLFVTNTTQYTTHPGGGGLVHKAADSTGVNSSQQ